MQIDGEETLSSAPGKNRLPDCGKGFARVMPCRIRWIDTAWIQAARIYDSWLVLRYFICFTAKHTLILSCRHHQQ